MRKKILLTCSTGLSTSMLVQRMQEAAIKYDINVEIAAFPIIKIRPELNDASALLLAPQIKFELARFKKLIGDKMLVEVIQSKDYGVMDGEKVLLETWRKINHESTTTYNFN